MDIATFNLEKELVEVGYTHIIGTDEVGRGPLCGPVLACAVMYKDVGFEIPEQLQKQFDLIRDSKKLSEKRREEIFEFIHEHFHVGIGLCDHNTIDRINILEASFLAMKKAVQDLLRASNFKYQISNSKSIPNNQFPNEQKNIDQKANIIILVDGNKVIPNFSHEQRAIVGGDGISKSIAAASIVAKVTRDRMMKEFALKYPQYGLEKHMGYGTKFHMEALKQYGPCEIHRKSFAPVKRALKIKE